MESKVMRFEKWREKVVRFGVVKWLQGVMRFGNVVRE
jgi:hypothetical protein